MNNAKSTGSIAPQSTVASALLTVSPSPTGTGTASSGSNSNTGAIVGGVVGSVVGLALIAGVVFFVIKKRRPPTPPSTQFTAAPMSPPSPSGVYTDTTPFVPKMAQPRLYVSRENTSKTMVSDHVPEPL